MHFPLCKTDWLSLGCQIEVWGPCAIYHPFSSPGTVAPHAQSSSTKLSAAESCTIAVAVAYRWCEKA